MSDKPTKQSTALKFAKALWRDFRYADRQSFLITDKLVTISDGGGFFSRGIFRASPRRITRFKTSDIVSVSRRKRNLDECLFSVIFGTVVVWHLFVHGVPESLPNYLGLALNAGMIAIGLNLIVFFIGFTKGNSFLVTVRTKSEQLRFKMSASASNLFASGLLGKLADQQQDMESSTAVSAFLDGLSGQLELLEQLPDNYLVLFGLALAKENAINCGRDVTEALGYFKKAYELGCDDAFGGFARCSLHLGEDSRLEISIPDRYLHESSSIRKWLSMVRGSVHADNLVEIADDDALSLSLSGTPTSMISLLSLEEIPDSVAYRFSRNYKGRSIRVNPNVKMSAEASRMLGRLLDQRPA